MRDGLAIVILALLATSCRHSRPSVEPWRGTFVLETITPPAEVKVGENLTLTLALRNVGEQRVRACVSGDGVDVWIRSLGSKSRLPLKTHGSVSDSPCPRMVVLEPGQTERFQETMHMWPRLSSGEAMIFARVFLTVGSRDGYLTTESGPVFVRALP